MCLVARCGCGMDIIITKDELDFVNKSYEMMESINASGDKLVDIKLKLRLIS